MRFLKGALSPTVIKEESPKGSPSQFLHSALLLNPLCCLSVSVYKAGIRTVSGLQGVLSGHHIMRGPEVWPEALEDTGHGIQGQCHFDS